MKTLPLGLLILSLLFSSCSSRYQVFDTTSYDVIDYDDDTYLYENEDLAITYDFWVHGGVMLFKVYNKQDRPLYLAFAHSTFSLNDKTLNYYPETYPTGMPVAGHRKRMQSIARIAPQSAEQVEGYPVSLKMHKFKGEQRRLRFNKDNTPFLFKNTLAYSYDEVLSKIRYIENEFWVSDVKWMKKKEFRQFEESRESKADKFYLHPNTDASPAFWVDLIFAVSDLLYIFL